jgi:ferredoxin-NADP reductase
MAQSIRFKAKVKSVQRHNNDVVSFSLYADRRLPRFIPGQFIHLALDEYDPASFWPESRVFSVANAVVDRRTVELTVSRQGDFTSRILDNIAPNLSVWCKGPYGDFYLNGEHGCSRSVLIAGGTGITPFCAFIDAAIKQGALPVKEVLLYYAAKTKELLVYRALTERCEREIYGFRVRYYVEEALQKECENIRTGRLKLNIIMQELAGVDDTVFYLSGPKSMIDTFRNSLVNDFGVADHCVLIDAWE